jgi:hypothetical protein
MAKVRLAGDVAGYIELSAAPTAGNNTITLPTSNGGANQFLKNTSVPGALGWSSLAESSSGELLVSSLGTAAAPAWSFVTDPDTGIYSPGANQVAISTNGTGRLFVDASGRAGIGVDTPLRRLHVNTSTGTDNVILGSAGTGLSSYLALNADGRSDLTGALMLIDYSSGIAEINNRSNQALIFGTNNTERMRLDSSGRLGLGSSSPTKKLQVEDTSATSTSTFANVIARFVSAASNGDSNIQLSNGVNASANIGIAGGANLYFGLDGAERARIDSSGRFLVGTSTAVAASTGPTGGFQHQGTNASEGNANLGRWGNDNGGYAIYFAKSRGATVGTQTVVADGDFLGALMFEGSDGTQLRRGASIVANVDGTPGSADMPGRLVFSTTADGASSPTERMRITQAGEIWFGNTSDYGAYKYQLPYAGNATNGMVLRNTDSAGSPAAVEFQWGTSAVGSITVTASATAYNTSSDYRLKENLVPLTCAIERVNDLQVHRFNFIADPDKTVDGFIAHEAQAVVPECVTGTKDEVDDDGNPVYQGIDQSKLVPLLTAALQEALQKIEDLETRLTAAGL